MGCCERFEENGKLRKGKQESRGRRSEMEAGKKEWENFETRGKEK